MKTVTDSFGDGATTLGVRVEHHHPATACRDPAGRPGVTVQDIRIVPGVNPAGDPVGGRFAGAFVARRASS